MEIDVPAATILNIFGLRAQVRVPSPYLCLFFASFIDLIFLFFCSFCQPRSHSGGRTLPFSVFSSDRSPCSLGCSCISTCARNGKIRDDNYRSCAFSLPYSTPNHLDRRRMLLDLCFHMYALIICIFTPNERRKGRSIYAIHIRTISRRDFIFSIIVIVSLTPQQTR